MSAAGPVTFDDYQRWATLRTDAMNFVHPLAHLARVEFGVRPSTPEEEAEVIRAAWVDFNPRDPGAVGDTWHVLPHAWVQHWKLYTYVRMGDRVREGRWSASAHP